MDSGFELTAQSDDDNETFDSAHDYAGEEAASPTNTKEQDRMESYADPTPPSAPSAISLVGASTWTYHELSAHLRDVLQLPDAASKFEQDTVDAELLLLDLKPSDLCEPRPHGLGLTDAEGVAVLGLMQRIRDAN